MRTYLVALTLVVATLGGCASFKEPREVTVARWCDHGRNAVLMAVNEIHMGQKAMVKQDWKGEGYTYIAGQKPMPPERKWGWDDNPVAEQWAASQWVHNLPLGKIISTDARALETEYVSRCNRINNFDGFTP